MPIPDFQTIMLPFVQTLDDGKTWTMKELTERLAIHFNLSDSERHELLPSGLQTVFSNRVAWAKSHLKNAGLICRGRHMTRTHSRIACWPAFFDYLWGPLMADTPSSQFASAKLAKSAVAKLKVVIHSARHIVPGFEIEASDER
jgi:restriction endonuclease Mrr